jgi:hypothetical protein
MEVRSVGFEDGIEGGFVDNFVDGFEGGGGNVDKAWKVI